MTQVFLFRSLADIHDDPFATIFVSDVPRQGEIIELCPDEGEFTVRTVVHRMMRGRGSKIFDQHYVLAHVEPVPVLD